MDHLTAPGTEQEMARLASLRRAMCAFVPREERFDRITRMAQRLLQVPVALITIVEDDSQWFRSAQGLPLSEAPRDRSFCNHTIAQSQALTVMDARLDRRFAKNPFVRGMPHLRAYCGWPLELAPGLRVGTLCVADTMPRSFSGDDLRILARLVEMAEAELRIDAMAHKPKVLLSNSHRDQRRRLLDPVTGGWSELGFQALIRATLPDVLAGKAHAALCALQIQNVDAIDVGEVAAKAQARDLLIAQFLRQRLPPHTVLCRLAGYRACALLVAHDEMTLSTQLAAFMRQAAHTPDAERVLDNPVEVACLELFLTPEHAHEAPDQLMQTLLARLAVGTESFQAVLC